MQAELNIPRVAVIGATGVGKTQLVRSLVQRSKYTFCRKYIPTMAEPWVRAHGLQFLDTPGINSTMGNYGYQLISQDILGNYTVNADLVLGVCDSQLSLDLVLGAYSEFAECADTSVPLLIIQNKTDSNPEYLNTQERVVRISLKNYPTESPELILSEISDLL